MASMSRRPISAEVGTLSEAPLLELIHVLESEAAGQRARTQTATRFVLWALGITGAMMIGFMGFATLLRLVFLWKLTGIFGLAGLLGLVSIYTLASRRHKETARVVAQCDDVRAIGALIDSMNIGDPTIAREICDALSRLLPRMTDETARLITPERVACLNRMLRDAAALHHGQPSVRVGASPGFVGLMLQWQPSRRPVTSRAIAGVVSARLSHARIEPVRAVIEASPLFGNSETLKYVERMGRYAGGSEDALILRDAALKALPALRERVERLKPGEMLLRPAEERFDAGLLLRPAGNAGNESDASLLRPVINEESRQVEVEAGDYVAQDIQRTAG